ncbi:transposase [Pararhodobacter zhoushanensis]|uniref:Transposase n=1 Tax=Pararhodobacter zhoushanensis TaxID=2479545 RepID=A0ABT3H1X1_9RHOB|nr:transposase [Pararhodobacter zhoushanensis]MCW1933782.1 transposase [Pararhodobacter zhoushanensis]
MSSYRRPLIPGARVFFTVTLAERGADLLTREIAALRDAVPRTRIERPFGIDAWVVLSDHMHCVLALPERDAGYTVRMAAIKARFTRAVRRSGFTPAPFPHNPYGAGGARLREGGESREESRGGESRGEPRPTRSERGVWQKRFWEHHIRDETDWANHIRYCWFNPVKHGLVEHPRDWPYSSWHRDNP